MHLLAHSKLVKFRTSSLFLNWLFSILLSWFVKHSWHSGINDWWILITNLSFIINMENHKTTVKIKKRSQLRIRRPGVLSPRWLNLLFVCLLPKLIYLLKIRTNFHGFIMKKIMLFFPLTQTKIYQNMLTLRLKI